MIEAIGDLLKIAQGNSWEFICLAMIIAGWRIFKYLGESLFGSDGLLTKFIKNLQEDSRIMKEKLAENALISSKLHDQSKEHIDGVELRLSTKIDKVSTKMDRVRESVKNININR